MLNASQPGFACCNRITKNSPERWGIKTVLAYHGLDLESGDVAPFSSGFTVASPQSVLQTFSIFAVIQD